MSPKKRTKETREEKKTWKKEMKQTIENDAEQNNTTNIHLQSGYNSRDNFWHFRDHITNNPPILFPIVCIQFQFLLYFCTVTHTYIP